MLKICDEFSLCLLFCVFNTLMYPQHLKGQCHEIFFFWLFYESDSPQPQSIPLGPFQIFLKIRGDIRKSRCTTCNNETGGKFATGVNDTGAKFDTGGK